MRHRDVKREDVVIYNVRMTGRKVEELQVSLASLRELAQAMPDSHELQQRLPPTHTTQTQQKKRSRNNPSTQSQPASVSPLAAPGDRIEVYWEEDPRGWFSGKVTSSRREDGEWVSRIEYDACEQWPRSHSAWHILDPRHDDHVTWRFAK